METDWPVKVTYIRVRGVGVERENKGDIDTKSLSCKKASGIPDHNGERKLTLNPGEN